VSQYASIFGYSGAIESRLVATLSNTKKGRVSRDDQLLYFVIPTLLVVFSVFLFDTYRYNLGSIQIENLRFSFTLFFCSAVILVYLGFILPRLFYFRFQEIAFAKQPPWHMLSICHVSTIGLVAWCSLGMPLARFFP